MKIIDNRANRQWHESPTACHECGQIRDFLVMLDGEDDYQCAIVCLGCIDAAQTLMLDWLATEAKRNYERRG